MSCLEALAQTGRNPGPETEPLATSAAVAASPIPGSPHPLQHSLSGEGWSQGFSSGLKPSPENHYGQNVELPPPARSGSSTSSSCEVRSGQRDGGRGSGTTGNLAQSRIYVCALQIDMK